MSQNNFFKFTMAGFFIGAAGTMPGLSGGTVALVLGIYERMLNALATLKPDHLLKLFQPNTRAQALQKIDWQFLLSLALGAFLGIFSFSFFIPLLMTKFPAHMYALFFGLMLLSIPNIFAPYGQRPKLQHWLIISLVSALTYFFTSLNTISPALDSIFFQVLCGALAIAAMLLPGISGSFVLVLLGNYSHIFSLVNRAFLFDLSAMLKLIPFIFGLFLGTIFFVIILRFCFAYFRGGTLAVLTGLMIGSLPKLWPFTNSVFKFELWHFNHFTVILFMIIGALITYYSNRIKL